MRVVLSCLGPDYHSFRHTARDALKISDEIDLAAETLRFYCVNLCKISLAMIPQSLQPQIWTEGMETLPPRCSVCLTVCKQRGMLRYKYIDGPLPHFVRAFQVHRYTPGRPWKYVCGLGLVENMKM